MSQTAPEVAPNAIGLTRLPSSAFLVSTVPVMGALIVQLSSRHWAWVSRASAALMSDSAAARSASAARIFSGRDPFLSRPRSASSLALRAAAADRSFWACTYSRPDRAWVTCSSRVRSSWAFFCWASASLICASTCLISRSRTEPGGGFSLPRRSASRSRAASRRCLAWASRAAASSRAAA